MHSYIRIYIDTRIYIRTYIHMPYVGVHTIVPVDSVFTGK